MDEFDEISQVIFPAGAFGASSFDSDLDTALRAIAVAASSDPKMEWAEKYGTDFENDVFMMHHYCWCDKDDCPWCVGCQCPESAYHYFVDDIEVSHDEYLALRKAEAYKANEHMLIRKDAACDYCLGTGVFEQWGPQMGAPNFWYKPTDFRVEWYKYIGRDMETHGECEIEKMVRHCIGSIGG